jgi:excisionase family DNA binding protein
MANMTKDLLTSTEAAKITGYNEEYIRRLLRSGKVNAKKWGRDWMIDQDSLLEYIEKKGRGPQPRINP